MDFALTTEQENLRSRLSNYLTECYDLHASRIAARSGAGWQPQVWKTFADDLGLLSVASPDVSGSESRVEEAMIIAEELGGALVIEPFISTAVLGAGLLRRSGGPKANEALTGVVAGIDRIAFASDEPDAYPSGHDVATTAVYEDGEWVLKGSKITVRDAPLATRLVISARTTGNRDDTHGIALFLLDFNADDPPSGVTVHSYPTIDDRRAADIELTELHLPSDALLGTTEQGWPIIESALDEATAAVCAEAVGLMRTVLNNTITYAKHRRQFGKEIGSFQALQHRMVDMYIELEKAVSASYLASLHLDDEPAVRSRAVSSAKATVNAAAKFIGENAVQLHGGMGMTQELEIAHYFKRLTAIQTEFGTTDDHLTRYARLS